MRVNELAIMIGTNQPEPMAAFYGEMLGLERIERFDGIVFDMAGINVRILPHGEISGSSHDPARHQLNLFVDDVRAEFVRLRALAVPFVREPEVESWGGTVATMQDPDGNYVQILQEPS
jgi:catechol 2,3-dioxygenase-like lactoylglutathione lyase family enzyme